MSVNEPDLYVCDACATAPGFRQARQLFDGALIGSCGHDAPVPDGPPDGPLDAHYVAQRCASAGDGDVLYTIKTNGLGVVWLEDATGTALASMRFGADEGDVEVDEWLGETFTNMSRGH